MILPRCEPSTAGMRAIVSVGVVPGAISWRARRGVRNRCSSRHSSIRSPLTHSEKPCHAWAFPVKCSAVPPDDPPAASVSRSTSAPFRAVWLQGWASHASRRCGPARAPPRGLVIAVTMTNASHSRLKSPKTQWMRNRRPSARSSDTKLSDLLWFGPCGNAIGALIPIARFLPLRLQTANFLLGRVGRASAVHLPTPAFAGGAASDIRTAAVPRSVT